VRRGRETHAKEGKFPAQLKQERTWRTRDDPFGKQQKDEKPQEATPHAVSSGISPWSSVYAGSRESLGR
jgi:hypothetical protein